MIIGRERLEKALPGYSIGDRLGSGAFGLVLAGHDQQADRPVAIKIVEADGSEQATRGFESEAQVLSGLDHPHVVKAFDYVETEGLCLVVMELMAGGTLTSRRAGMAPEQACAVGLAVAAALAHAHGRGVLHRDIKADNILFAADGTPKVGDFGIAKLFEGSAATASGRVGTPMYMAPEQIASGRLGPATDLYALGVVLYQLLTGAPPFDPKQSLPALWNQHLNDPPRPMTGVAAPVEPVVLRALAKAPADRHPDATAFALDLARAATEAYGANWTARAGVPLNLDDDIRRLASPPPPPPAPASIRSLQPPAGDDDDETVPAERGEAVGRAESPRPEGFRRQGRRRWTRVAGVAVVLATAVPLVLWRALGAAEPPAETGPAAVSRRLAAAASRLADDQPDLARRMAVAAYRTAPPPKLGPACSHASSPPATRWPPSPATRRPSPTWSSARTGTCSSPTAASTAPPGCGTPPPAVEMTSSPSPSSTRTARASPARWRGVRYPAWCAVRSSARAVTCSPPTAGAPSSSGRPPPMARTSRRSPPSRVNRRSSARAATCWSPLTMPLPGCGPPPPTARTSRRWPPSARLGR
nr:serine/threonine-protein kinase [Parafrankia sp. EUN1f]